MSNDTDQMCDIHKRLNQYIEYATATKRFSDVGFYEDVKSYISALETKHREDMLKLCDECLKIIHSHSSPGHAYDEVREIKQRIGESGE